MIALIITYATAGLLTAATNIYHQLYIVDNWPPSNWRAVSWPAVAIVTAICLVLWPAVWPLMWIEEIHTKHLRHKRNHPTNKGKTP